MVKRKYIRTLLTKTCLQQDDQVTTGHTGDQPERIYKQDTTHINSATVVQDRLVTYGKITHG